MAVQAQQQGELAKAVEIDQHGIEPIGASDRDSTPAQQFWIWFGANITPTSWVVGAIGPQLGLSLWQSILIMLVGQLAGCLLFGFFTIMGHRTGVSQLALGRMAFGRRGNAIPSVIQGLITLSWVGLNTYVVLSAASFCLHKLGLPDSKGTQYGVAAVIMVIQVGIGTLGFYAIRTFEKWTVPVLAVVMAIMTVAGAHKGNVVWNKATVHGSEAFTAMTQFMTAVGIGWGFSWVAWASDYSRFTRPDVTEKRLYWVSALGTFIAVYLARRPRRGDGQRRHERRPGPARRLAVRGHDDPGAARDHPRRDRGQRRVGRTPPRCASSPPACGSGAGSGASSPPCSPRPSSSGSWPRRPSRPRSRTT